MDQLITQEVEKYARQLLNNEITEKYTYHNIFHTEYVVNQAKLIGRHSGLNDEELNLVVVAAWFHDIGFVVSSTGHEEESKKIAEKFLLSKGVSKEQIEKVKDCIEATKMPHLPGDNMMAKVMCDADMSYLSEDFYYDRTVLLRKEWNNESEKKLSKKDYYTETLEVFKDHKYFTKYARKEFEPGKEKNILLLNKLINNSGKKKKKKAINKLKAENKKLAEKLEKEKLPGRGVESMFRLTARNQINLSSIADNKANILISINSIVLTVLVSIGIGKISDYPVITFPAIVFITTCLITIIFAILSTRPKISSGKFSKEDIHNKKINLLFFGNFYNMKMEEYEWAVKEMMDDQDYLYTSMIKDQYSLGKVISQKYKLLRIAYTVFMIGLILSSILFALFILAVPE